MRPLNEGSVRWTRPVILAIDVAIMVGSCSDASPGEF
jgi:hypothetical protein